MGSYCFGIDVGGTTVKCGLFQTDGNLVDKWEIPTRTENKGENILPDVAKAIQDKMAEKGIEKADVEGVGIGIPGPINSKGEAACAVNLYWGFTPVAQILHDLTGLKACAGNDANVAALGEAWKGAAAGSDNVIHGDTWYRCGWRNHCRWQNRCRNTMVPVVKSAMCWLYVAKQKKCKLRQSWMSGTVCICYRNRTCGRKNACCI